GDKIDSYQQTVADMHNSLSQQQLELSSNQMVLKIKQDAFDSKIAVVESNLSEQQIKLQKAELEVYSQQQDITNQFSRISVMQSDLYAAGTNLSAQSKELSDVQYFIKNLYAKTETETFTIKDTNNLMILPSPNGSVDLIIRLSRVPIKGS